jgi:hypothetical protein
VNNLLRIMSLEEKDMHRVVFVKARQEGGFSSVYDPGEQRDLYQVFIHSILPYRTAAEQEFTSFEQARSYAAKLFSQDWEMLSWDLKTKRPCEEGGRECGSGSCDTCVSMKKDAEATGDVGTSGCGSCGHA